MDPAVIEAGGVMRLVRGLAPGEKDNFVINRSDNLTSTLAENLGYVRSVALVVGFITLLGAAIGLMNIMLVSVTERTTEIGVRKALGAPSAAVRAQFLVESLLVSQAGGVAGFLLGLTMGNLVSVAVEGPFVIPWGWLLGSILLCLVVGVAAGLYPAARAARLDPIESLRYE
jgi:putative ABC transport system permease protein